MANFIFKLAKSHTFGKHIRDFSSLKELSLDFRNDSSSLELRKL